ncbi:MAG TPA: fatty acid desaturase [Opitutaceae bacterium]|nr:fatty acid desaturase [Opitutaceae bacterium]
MAVDWYRTPLPSAVFKQLHERSDLRALWQAGGFLALALGASGFTYWAWHGRHWLLTALGLYAYGIIAHFYVNGMHELSHGTVFRTKWLGQAFLRVISFLGWLHPEAFNASHQRHHRFTLHPPDDLEVTLPATFTVRHFFVHLVFNPGFCWFMIRRTWRLATGHVDSMWDQVCLPDSQPDLRAAVVRWARLVLAGHVLVAVVSFATGQWIIPLLISTGPFIGGGLWFLCNNSQHTGRRDNVPDFRLCCRTIEPNALVRFLYWQMNYHTEHHMYAAVPCYHLARLHREIRHELPPVVGLIGAWREIAAVQRRQRADPTYVPEVHLPVGP